MIDVTRLMEEAERIEKMGVVDVTFKNGGGKDKTIKAVCIGYTINDQEEDCLLFVGPYGSKNRHTYRSINVLKIKEIKVSETQSFNRYSGQKARGVPALGTPVTRGVIADGWGDCDLSGDGKR